MCCPKPHSWLFKVTSLRRTLPNCDDAEGGHRVLCWSTTVIRQQRLNKKTAITTCTYKVYQNSCPWFFKQNVPYDPLAIKLTQCHRRTEGCEGVIKSSRSAPPIYLLRPHGFSTESTSMLLPALFLLVAIGQENHQTLEGLPAWYQYLKTQPESFRSSKACQYVRNGNNL